MRAGKENGLLLPSTNGTAGQFLISQANGNVVWSTLNAVTVDTTQTVTGAKTFSAATTNFGAAAAPAKLATAGTQLVFEQTGSAMGGTRLSILNETGQNGAMFEQLGTNDLVDFIFKTPSGQGNVRYERRAASFLDTQNLTYEFQIGTPTTPALVAGDVVTRVAGTLKVGTNTVYHQGNIPGKAGDVVYNGGTGLSNAQYAQIENGYLRLLTGLPTVSAAGGVAIGAKDLGGRIMPAFVGPTGLDVTVQPHIGRNKVTMMMPIVNSTTPSLWGLAAQTVLGTATARTPATGSVLSGTRRVSYLSSATAGTLAGYRNPTLQWWRGNLAGAGGFHFTHSFGISDSATISTKRMFVGLIGSTNAPTNVEPTSLTNLIGICKLSTSSNLFIINNDGSGTATATDLGSNFPGTGTTLMYTLTLFTAPNSSTIGWRVDRQDIAGIAPVIGTFSTDIPATTTFLTSSAWVSNNSLAVSAGLDLINFYVETDN